jgi:inosine/xanthosine triphosphate pyrophosphatase family protein
MLTTFNKIEESAKAAIEAALREANRLSKEDELCFIIADDADVAVEFCGDFPRMGEVAKDFGDVRIVEVFKKRGSFDEFVIAKLAEGFAIIKTTL